MQNRSGRSQNVSPPSIVPGASIRPIVGIPAARRPGLERRGLRGSVGLARSERDRAAVGHQQRVEGVDEIRASRARLEDVDARTERGQRLDEGVVLAAGDLQIDRVEEPVGRVVERGPEGGTGSLDQDVEQRADMLWAPKRRASVVIDAKDTRSACRRGGSAYASGSSAGRWQRRESGEYSPPGRLHRVRQDQTPAHISWAGRRRSQGMRRPGRRHRPSQTKTVRRRAGWNRSTPDSRLDRRSA